MEPQTLKEKYRKAEYTRQGYTAEAKDVDNNFKKVEYVRPHVIT